METKKNYLTKLDLRGKTKKEKLEMVDFFVEADNFSQFVLWQRWNEELDWVEINSGFGFEIGEVKVKNVKLPVWVEFYFAIINGHLISFYYSNSRCVDWNQVEDYVKKYVKKYDNNSRNAMCDANNFHQCVGFCKK